MAKGRNGRVGQDAPAVPVSPPSPPRRGSLRTILIAAAAIAGIAAIALVVWRVIPSGVPAVPLNILLVTLDTTRADHLGSYGWKRARTGEMDRLASEGVRFDKAFSPVPITLPAHTSLLTGLYPFATGVRNNGNFYLSDKVETIATVLRARGYRTAAFLSSFVLDRRYGLGRGFETYDDRMDAQSEGGGAPDVEVERRGDKTAAALDAWLTSYAQQKSAPFFAWLHLYDPHAPYAAPPPFREEFADAPYDGEIAFCDAIVGQLVERLGELGLVDRTLVAITGDHGEGLGDHGESAHGFFIYNSTLHVPLIFKLPAAGARRQITQAVSTVDVLPTILDELQIAVPKAVQGHTLAAALRGKIADASPIYSESFLPRLHFNWSELRGLQDESYKFIDGPKPELYDLSSDP